MTVISSYQFFLPQVKPEARVLLEALLNPETSPPLRFQAGFQLNQKGDPRVGVGLDAAGLPDLDWIEIPGGEFIYQAGESYQTLPTFYITRYPITVQQFAAFLDDDGYANPDFWTSDGWAWHRMHGLVKPSLWESPKWHIGNHPIVGLTWYEASAFATWLANRLGYPADLIRLPSEQEWEKAARGVDGRVFPWGRTIQSGKANINESYSYHYVGEFFLKRTAAVGAFVNDRSPYGVMDLCGNVREWTSTDYHRIGHVVRGGGWFSNRSQAQLVFRNWFYDRNGDHSIGFRLAAVINPSNSAQRFSSY